MKRVQKSKRTVQISPDSVDESAETIEISDDDSTESVIDVCDNNDKTEDFRTGNLGQSNDSGNIENIGASNLPRQHNSRKGSSKIAGSGMSTPDLSSVGIMTPDPSRKQMSGRKPGSRSFPESVLDEDDLEHLRLPFSFGWKRELVYRSTVTDPNSKRSMCDVYYFPPSGRKLRSMIEISTYLQSQENSPVNLTHFTFKRKPFFQSPHEIVRSAGKPNYQLKNVASFRKVAQKQKKSTIGNSSNSEKTTEEINPSATSVDITPSANQLTTSAEDQGAIECSNKATGTSLEILSNPDLQVRTPATFPRPRGRPKGSKTTPYVLSLTPGSPKRRGRPKGRRWSPDWTPQSAGYSGVPLKKRHTDMADASSQSYDNDDEEDDDDDDNSDLQDILGTPSKLIASIIRPDPPKRNVDDGDEVTRYAIKKIKFMSDTSAHNFSGNTTSLTPVLGKCITTPRPTFVVANSHFLTSNLTSLKLCNSARPDMRGVEPSRQCKQCGQHYQLECAQLGPNSTDKNLCPNCVQNQMGCQQQNPQKGLLKIVSPSIGTHGLGSLTSSVVLSSCIVPVSSFSSVLSKPLMTPSSQFLPQVLSPIFLIPGQNTAPIPPPPPLASCPRFDTPVTLLPLQFTSDVPPPPRLHLCTIPQACHPPPLHIGPGLPSCSQTSSFLTHHPTLQQCPPLLTSKPYTMQPAVTPSSRLKIVARIDRSKTRLPTRYVLVPAVPKVRLPNALTATTLQTPLITSVSELSGSTGSAFSGHIINVEEASTDTMPYVNVGKKSTFKTIRNLLNKQKRSSSPSSGSDIDDYPPVSFEPVTSSTHILGQPESAGKRQKSNFTKNSRTDDQLYSSTKPPRMIKDLLSRSADDTQSWIAASLPSVIFDDDDSSNSHVFGLSGHKILSTNIMEQSNSQLLTVPHSVASRLDLTETTTQRTCNTELLAPPDIYNSGSTAQSLFNFNIFDRTAMSLQMSTIFSHSHPIGKPTVDPKQTRKDFMTSFRILQTSFPIMMKIFRCLSIPDLLRASCVCKVWHLLGMQSCLWKHVRLEGVRIRNWQITTRFLHLVGVKSLSLASSVLQASQSMSSAGVWDTIQKTVPTLTCLEQLFFDQVSSSVLDALTEKMPHLMSIGARDIVDSSCSSVAMIPAAKMVENMSHAIEAVTSGKVSTINAAKLFQVSEKDLIHLTQTSDKLTSEEEAAVLLCCMRLCRMGFSVQKDIVVSKCQEMFARRYSTTSPFPISDSCCNDLYHRNLPLFTPETEVKNIDTLRKRFDVHYSSLRRLYNSLWPRAILNASQVLVFDLKSFHLDKEPGFNSLRSVAVTVLSLTPACTRSLPVVIVWPKYVETAHPYLISVMAKRGIPTILQVFHYFQKILSLVTERPLVIICNGNASLLSEKLISKCVSDSVYLYCVPPDIAKYTFPGFHGGLLHILKDQIPDRGIKCGEFASRLLSLLKSKKKTISHSTKLSFTTTGVFPLNARAPTQYQAVDLNAVPHQQYSWRKSGSLTEQRSSLSSGEVCELKKPTNLVCDEIVKNQKEKRKGINEHANVQLRNKTKKFKSDQIQPGLLEKTARSITRPMGKEHKRVNYARMLAKKMLRQAKGGHSSSLGKIRKPFLSSVNTNNLNSGTTRVDVDAVPQGNALTHQVSDIHSAKSPLPLEDSNTKHVASFIEMVNELVDHGVEVEVEKSDITACSKASDQTKCSQNEVQIPDRSCVATEFEMSTDLDSKKETSADSFLSETKQIISPSKGSGVRVRGNRASTTLPISQEMSNCGPSEVSCCQQPAENSNQTEEMTPTQGMEVDALVGGNVSEVQTENQSSLKLSGAGSSEGNNCKENEDSKNKITSRELLTSKKGKVYVDKNEMESLTVNAATERKLKKKNQSREKLPQTSCADTPEMTASKHFRSGNASDGKPQTCGNDKFDTGQECQLKLLSHISLIDHDYILKCEDSKTTSSYGSHTVGLDLETVFSFPESNEVTVNQVETVPEVRTPVDCVPPTGADDVTETVVYTREGSENISGGSSKHTGSENSSILRSDTGKTKIASPAKHHCTSVGRKNEDENYSSCIDLQTSADKEASGSDDNRQTSDDDAGDSDDNRQTSDDDAGDSDDRQTSDDDVGGSDDNRQTSDDDAGDSDDRQTSDDDAVDSDDNRQTSDLEEEEEDDDDSKCQMCMRSTPPHSKDKIINWVDCDENCGRWFHVICVVRSQSKADTKHFVCPSCRCNR